MGEEKVVRSRQARVSQNTRARSGSRAAERHMPSAASREFSRRKSGSGRVAVDPRSNQSDDPNPPGLQEGVKNPLYVGGLSPQSTAVHLIAAKQSSQAQGHRVERKSQLREAATVQQSARVSVKARYSAKGRGSAAAAAAARSSSQQGLKPDQKGDSPISTLTVSTANSISSSSSRRVGRPAVAPSPQVTMNTPGESRRRSGSSSSDRGPKEGVPAPLVPALLAPVPPPPRKRKKKVSAQPRTTGDIESGEAQEDVEEDAVMEDAPDKTLMEMLQTYLKKQDIYTQVVLAVVLLLLAGGALGAYVLVLVYAITEGKTTYIVLSTLFSVVLIWVVWNYCFSGDEELQDQSAIAQDIATLYASIPDHTALRGVSERGRAQFTAFKYEKAEMMFTAVTDDGVSLGSERGSELMMEGADPSCPLCNVVYVEGTDLCLLPCLHVFHKKCINKWCDRHIVCPLCKRHLEAPEPLHSLTAFNGSVAHSEPGGNHNQGAHGGGGKGAQWRHMLGSVPGPASGHGSERGLGGTRSDDGLWNDRVLNAAQRQVGGRGHNRVTSFSSETRRASSARGRVAERGIGGGRGGPPLASSAGAAATTRAGQRAQSVGGQSGRMQQHRVQRKRSSSFTNTSERTQRGSGRVAHGTAPLRGGGAGSVRAGDPGSPRSRSDIGIGVRDGDPIRTTDVLLSRHASRMNNGAGGTTSLAKQTFGEDGASSSVDGSEELKGELSKHPTSAVEVSSNKSSSKGSQSSRGPRSAVITVRKVKNSTPKTASAKVWSSKPLSEAGGVRDLARSGDESEPDSGLRSIRGFYNNYDSPDKEEFTTKALTYSPRKPKSSSKGKKDGGPGHRRVWSTGSNSADESTASTSKKKPRRRPTIPGSKSGSGNHAALATAAAAATAEAVSKLLRRPQEDQNHQRSSTTFPRTGRRRASTGAIDPGMSSGGESGSDSTRGDTVQRTSSARTSGRPVSTRRAAISQQPKMAPPNNGPVTRGTPAPPMAAARVATWNSTATHAPAPSVNVPIDRSLSPGEESVIQALARRVSGTVGSEVEGGEGSGVSPLTGDERDTNKDSNSYTDWTFRVPASSESADDFGGSEISLTSAKKNLEDGQPGPPDAGGKGSSAVSSGASSLASKAFWRTSEAGKQLGASAVRLLGSGSATGGNSSGGGVGGEEREMGADGDTEPSSNLSKVTLRPSSSVQELIQTYEKARSSSDEKTPPVEGTQRWGGSTKGQRKSKRNFPRGSASSRINSFASDGGATESELDEDIIRPKLSYQSSKSSRGIFHSRSSSKTSLDGHQAAALASEPIKAAYSSNPGIQESLGTASSGGSFGLNLEVPVVNPDGEDWGNEEPYARPKLSYGGGLQSSRKGSFAFDSAPGAPSVRSER